MRQDSLEAIESSALRKRLRSIMLNAHPTLRFADLLATHRTEVGSFWNHAAVHHTYSARGALYQLCRALPQEKGREVLLPAFHCTTVVEPFVRAGYRVRFYRIRRDLSIDYTDLLAKLSKQVAVVLVINFFGFPANIGPILEMRRKFDCLLVEDWAHSFVSAKLTRTEGERGDCAVFSFSKLVPSHVGGGLCASDGVLPYRIPRKTIGLKQSIVLFKRLFEQIIQNMPDDVVIKSIFRYVEDKRVAVKKAIWSPPEESGPGPIQYVFDEELALAGMPWVSRAILRRSDLGKIMSIRRRNYGIVSDLLHENEALQKLFPAVARDVCPWAYPVLVHERRTHEHALRNIGVPIFTFGEILHPLVYEVHDSALDDAKCLANNLMMIPVHQNLEEKDIVEFCVKLNSCSVRWAHDQCSSD